MKLDLLEIGIFIMMFATSILCICGSYRLLIGGI